MMERQRLDIRDLPTKRLRLTVAPKWKGSIEGWTKKFMLSQLWRFHGTHDLEDLMQDGYIYYLVCKQKYGDRFTEPRHFMALYMRCVVTHLHDLAAGRYDRWTGTAGKRAKESELPAEIPEFRNSGMNDVEQLLREAPDRVRRILARLGLIETSRKYLKPRRQHETINEYLCRLAGCSKNLDMVGEVLEWIYGEDYVGYACKRV